ncbi:drug resistance transporter, EmrB/QacA subfamily [Curtobacterium sp. UNCCL20]|uniref:MDR family MFS transporter n=1 Tax=Curtobacterium sp. UNCCL20 TaxID=1502773 RepID=UPI0008893B80|nr:MDR family MFS transporter [Curtobacterium sp. UNCCL20]SDQ31834.1 drug resistance transporter, EmrB/QacA subfamily [Curtobacterium sp. UNCCL20]
MTATAPVTVQHGRHATEATTASGAPGQQPLMTHRQILLVIYGLMAGMFLSSLGQTVFGTAIRTIGDDLHGLDQQAWVTTAYLITSTIATPIYGKLSDIFGRRPLYIFGIVVFILGAVLSSMSTSMLMLAGFRAVQGIGAGALMSLPLAIMGDILAPRERAKYQGYFLAVFGISSVIGPLIGGLLAGTSEILWITGWRWVLLINVPIGIAALIMVIVFLHLPKVHDKADKPKVDWWGATAVIVTLVPLLLVAEQGRTWGWGSPAAIACYVVGVVGLVGLLLIESKMGDAAIIPLKLFRSGTFSMATVIGFLVGFAMFGAMLTIPLYLQIVVGLSPTESGFATLPLVGGLMIASITSGQIVARVGRYRIFPVIGTGLVSVGYVVLTFMTIDKPLWFLMIGMFLIGLGLGSVMQSLTLASQGSVEARDMGVATSSATFFRQIGGTLGTAVLLSILFSVMPANILSATANEKDLGPALDAALNPTVASAKANQGAMDKIWTPVVTPLTKTVQAQLDDASATAKQAADAAVTQQVTAAVQQQVAAGALPAASAQAAIDQQVRATTPAAEQSALEQVADKAHASVQDGTVSVDWSNASQREYWVDELTPDLAKKIDDGSTQNDSATSTNDTSFLTGADSRLTRPFMAGFNASSVTIYWVGLGVILLAFVLTWFFRVPPLRQRSALQERADAAGSSSDEPDAEAELEASAGMAAAEAGSFTGPMTGSTPTQRR